MTISNNNQSKTEEQENTPFNALTPLKQTRGDVMSKAENSKMLSSVNILIKI